jgi:hypothetical protein
MRNLSEFPEASTMWRVLTEMAAHNQFVHLYGQRGARLDRDQSVHGSVVNPRTMLVIILSPMLFWAPNVHLHALEKLWVDRQVHIGPWTEFISKLNAEWQDLIIIVR